MFIALHTQLRRNRRKVLIALSVIAVAAVLMTAHSALMGANGDQMTNAAAVCLAIGGCAAAVGVALVAIQRLHRRPLWLMPVPAAPALVFVPASTGPLVRAGPPPLLQIFRL